MKLTKEILIEMIEEELKECGMGPPPMPMVAGPHEDVPTLKMTPKGEVLPPEDESPYPEGPMELITMIADMLDDFLGIVGGAEEEHDCEVMHPDESHEKWRVKVMLGKEESAGGGHQFGDSQFLKEKGSAGCGCG